MKLLKVFKTASRINQIATALGTTNTETLKVIGEFVKSTKLSNDQIVREIKEMDAK